MPRDEEVAQEGEQQHQKRCPGCLSDRTRIVPGENFMGCDTCGHTWSGKDYGMNDES